MKIKEVKELHQKTKEELLKILKDLTEEIEKLRIDLSTNKLKDTNVIKEKKKDVARILTILKEKETEDYKLSKEKEVVEVK